MELSRQQWNTFVQKTAGDGGLLQSWEWGEFQRARGRRVWREVVREQGAIVAVAQMVGHPLPLTWRYGYVPRGPLLRSIASSFAGQAVLQQLMNRAREEKMMFVRIEPESPLSLRGVSNASDEAISSGLPRSLSLPRNDITSGRPLQPTQTLPIDLTQPEDALLAAMHQKTRYNIRLAERKGVAIAYYGAPSSVVRLRRTGLRSLSVLDIFYMLLQETARRDGFHGHERSHYEAMLAALDAHLFIASLDAEPLAAALVVYFGDHAYYMHGASTQKHREVMAPYALHWQIMRAAKERGCRVYDFWGVDENAWPGVTRFKRGFAPSTPLTEYPGAYDIILNPWQRRIFQASRYVRRYL